MNHDISFKTPYQLLDFVLTECGDMKYNFFATKKHLHIINNLLTSTVYYAIKLLKEQFDIDILILEAYGDLDEGYLDKTNIEELYLTTGKKIPDLPRTIKRIRVHKGITTTCYFLHYSRLRNEYDIYTEHTNAWSVVIDSDDDFTFSCGTLEEALQFLKDEINHTI